MQRRHGTMEDVFFRCVPVVIIGYFLVAEAAMLPQTKEDVGLRCGLRTIRPTLEMVLLVPVRHNITEKLDYYSTHIAPLMFYLEHTARYPHVIGLASYGGFERLGTCYRPHMALHMQAAQVASEYVALVPSSPEPFVAAPSTALLRAASDPTFAWTLTTEPEASGEHALIRLLMVFTEGGPAPFRDAQGHCVVGTQPADIADALRSNQISALIHTPDPATWTPIAEHMTDVMQVIQQWDNNVAARVQAAACLATATALQTSKFQKGRENIIIGVAATGFALAILGGIAFVAKLRYGALPQAPVAVEETSTYP